MMRFTVNSKVQQPTVRNTRPVPQTKTSTTQPQNAMGAMFQNMLQGKYRSSGCSSCSGAR